MGDGNIIILITALLGGLIIALGIFFGTKAKDESMKEENKQEMNKLRDTIVLKNKEIQDKQDEVTLLNKENQRLINELLSTTTSIRTLTTKVDEITSQTNTISNQINDEIREKGTFALSVDLADEYTFSIGSNFYIRTRKSMEKGTRLQVGFPFRLKIKNDSLFINTAINNKEGHLVLYIVDNKWGLDKSKTFSINFDEKGLEVMNNYGRIIFQLNLDNNIINVQAINYNQNGLSVVTNEGTFIRPYGAKDISKILELGTKYIEPMFEHEGEGYLHTRVKK